MSILALAPNRFPKLPSFADLKASFARGRRKGFTLVEVLLVLAVATAIIVIGLRIYSSVQDSSRQAAVNTEIGQIRGAIETAYQSQGSYTNLALGDIANALPASLINGTGATAKMVNPFGGSFKIAPDTSNGGTLGDSYDIIVTNLPPGACASIASMDLGRSVISVVVDPANGTTVAAGADTTFPILQAAAAGNCTGKVNSVAFQFH